MKTVTWTKKTDVIHVETPLGIINIRCKLHDSEGRNVDSIEILNKDYAGEPKVIIDPPTHNIRLIELKPGEPIKPKVMKLYTVVTVDGYSPHVQLVTPDMNQALNFAKEWAEGWDNMIAGCAGEIYFNQEESGNMEDAVSVQETEVEGV